MTLVGNAQVEWRGDEFSRDVLRAQKNGLDAGGALLVELIKVRLSKLGTPTSKTGLASLSRGLALLKKIGGGPVRRAIGTKKSKRAAQDIALAEELKDGLVDPPGGSPRLRSGSLRRSVVKSNATPSAVYVGSGIEYALIHEIGGTVQNPGGQPYLPWLVKKLGKFVGIKKTTANTAKGVKYTKPHAIRIPARPYLRPSLSENADAIARTMLNEMEQTLAEGRK